MIRICCITYKEVERLVREVLESHEDSEVEFSIVEGLRTEILEEEKRKIIESADVAIAAGANAQIAEASLQVPVLKLGHTPAVVTYRQPISKNMREYLQMIGRQVENIVYADALRSDEELRAVASIPNVYKFTNQTENGKTPPRTAEQLEKMAV